MGLFNRKKKGLFGGRIKKGLGNLVGSGKVKGLVDFASNFIPGGNLIAKGFGKASDLFNQFKGSKEMVNAFGKSGAGSKALKNALRNPVIQQSLIGRSRNAGYVDMKSGEMQGPFVPSTWEKIQYWVSTNKIVVIISGGVIIIGVVVYFFFFRNKGKKSKGRY